MTHSRTIRFFLFAVALGVFLPAERMLAGDPPKGSEVHFHAQLVWGTNDDPAKHPKFREVDSASRKILDPFKWKHFLVTENKNFSLNPGEQKKVKMSDKCTIIAKHKGKAAKGKGEVISVTLLGDGKPIGKHTKSIVEKHTIALCGSLKNGTAWAVLLKRVPEKLK